jgi:hypothetical protein
MANDTRTVTGAIALIKVNGSVIGLMKTVRVQESVRRQPVRGIGTILPSAQEVVEWDGTLSCDSMLVDFKNGGVPGAIRRVFPNIASQVLNGNSSFEDQLVLDGDGVQVDIYKKITDVIDVNTGIITPTTKPVAIVKNCLIESDSFDITEGSISGHSQSFKYLTPVTYLS